MKRRELLGLMGGLAGAGAVGALAPQVRAAEAGAKLFADDNLVAWCIVPFDAKNRGPEERAAMMKGLGLKHYAYDWRDQHLPQLDRELDALQKNGVSLDAFWFPFGAQPEQDGKVRLILDFLKRRGAKPQLWLSTGVGEAAGTQAERIAASLPSIRWVATEADKIGCKVALYNHGGWYGEPENQVAILERLKMPNAGIVYNFHHGHGHIARFPELMRSMKPHLLALNINGMNKSGSPKILGVGKGEEELSMLRVVAQSGWRGPVGILGHREELDAEVALRENLDGVRAVRGKL